jgi:GDP-4-dehydro-6-deoxy-D-mannose reductase
MKYILVTGAGGALGRAVVARFRKEAGCRILTAGRGGEDLRFDLRNAPDFMRLIEEAKPDLILHLAATFSNEFDEAYTANVEGTRRLLEAALAADKAPRVLLVGSAAEYGAVRPDDNPIRESHALGPVSVYGLSKAWQAQLASLYAARGADVVVARLFNLEGPGLSERLFGGRIQQQIREIREGRRTEIEVGPLTAIRDYVGADEAADQIVAIAALGQSGCTYHVASGRPVTMRDLLGVMLAAEGLTGVTVRESAALSNRAGYDVPAIYADMTSTQQLMQQRKHSAAT